jgi:hypothetical protein
MTAEKEAALAAASAAFDDERMIAVACAKEEARHEQALVVAELRAEIALERSWRTITPRDTTPAGAGGAPEAAPTTPSDRTVRTEAMAKARQEASTQVSLQTTRTQDASLQTVSLSNSTVLDAVTTTMPPSLWRAHLWRSLVRIVWCS